MVHDCRRRVLVTNNVGELVRSRHRAYLIRRIAWRLQANAEGGHSERALRRAEELANVADVRPTPPRLAAVGGAQRHDHATQGGPRSRDEHFLFNDDRFNATSRYWRWPIEPHVGPFTTGCQRMSIETPR
ncbi:MAG: DUF2924 domain-containing protein [Phycisphaerae bacterium]|nr:DUF2924 domain-containing protein [Phycisphaerae bacterium]